MKIILKFILKNIKEKKLRTFLIVISIVASTALFFAANGIGSTINQTMVDTMKSFYGSAEIQISSGPKASSPYVSTTNADFYSNKLDYVIGEMNAGGQYEHTKDDIVSADFEGLDYDDLMKMNPITFSEEQDIKPFQGNKIIISKKTAEKYNLNIGTKIDIRFGGGKELFTVVGIANADGIFKLESQVQGLLAIIPKTTAQSLNNEKGKVSSIYIKTKNPDDKDAMIQTLSKAYKNCNVNETIDMKQINESTGFITHIFMVLLVIVLGMSIFIIYTVFKVITIERLPIIGTFRSIGATKLTTDLVLILESAVYGIIGGIIGVLGGIGIVKLAAIGLSSAAGGLGVSINYSLSQILQAFIFAVIVSMISALVPIIRVSKFSVKDVVLNTVDTVERKKIWKLIVACIFVAFAFFGPKLCPSANILIVGFVGMILGIIGVVILIPYFTNFFVVILQWLYALIFRNEGILAAKNIRNNKNIINNISLLTIGISTLFMLNVVSTSLGKSLVQAYDVFKYDIEISGNIQNDTLPTIRNTNGVLEADGMYTTNYVNIVGHSNSIMEIWGYKASSFDKYFNVNFDQDKNNVLKNMYDNREIALTDSLANAIGAKVGDVITLETPKGNEKYRISGTLNTLMENGSMAIISGKYLQHDFKVSNYTRAYVNTTLSPDQVAKTLTNEFKGQSMNVQTFASIEAQNELQNDVMLMLIRMFPIISLIIGAFGVLNNFLISFMERKRQLAVMASVGMSKRQTRKMLFVEAFSVGIIGAVMGILGGLMFTNIIPYFLKAWNFPMPMTYDVITFITCFILGVAITMVSSLGPSFKSSKLNIIDAIKYE
jgi:putative ABC transport system permease protein